MVGIDGLKMLMFGLRLGLVVVVVGLDVVSVVIGMVIVMVRMRVLSVWRWEWWGDEWCVGIGFMVTCFLEGVVGVGESVF